MYCFLRYNVLDDSLLSEVCFIFSPSSISSICRGSPPVVVGPQSLHCRSYGKHGSTNVYVQSYYTMKAKQWRR